MEAWEFADPALPDKRSQDEYNKILKDCDECIVLFWRKVGKYSKEELEIAYKERFGEGKLSRLVVYFKDVKDGDIPKDKKGEKEFEKLKKVKNGFAKKHGEKFYASYRDIESVENDFLLFFIDKNVPSAKLSTHESKIMLDGVEMGNISNLSLAYNNKPYQKLSKEVSDLDNALRLLESTNSDNTSIPLFKKQLSEKKKELQKFENNLIEMAQTITRITTSDPDNEKVALAQKQFAEGNYYEALAILNREEILAEAAQCNADFDSARALADKAKDKYRAAIETIILRIQYLSVAKVKNWFNECKELYEKAVLHARNCYADSELADLLFKQALFLQNNNQFDDSLCVYEEVLKIRRQLAKASPEAYLPDVAQTLNNLGNLHSATSKHGNAEKEYGEALEIRRQLAKASPEAYLPDVAMTLNNLGILHRVTGKHGDAEKEYGEALEIRRKLAEASPEAYLPNVAMTLNNLGNLHSDTGKHGDAEKEYGEALEIRRKLAEASPEAYLPDVAATLFNIALLYMKQGNQHDALEAAQESLEIFQKMEKLSSVAFHNNVEKGKQLLDYITGE